MIAGEYAETLRAVGDFLDGEYAVRASIGNDDRAVIVTWHAPSGVMERRRYLQYDLAALSKRARAQRGSPIDREMRRHFVHAADTPTPIDGEGRGELLRTLGQHLDEDGLDLEGILEAATGYRVLGSHPGQPIDRFYTTGELIESSRKRRLLRKS